MENGSLIDYTIYQYKNLLTKIQNVEVKIKSNETHSSVKEGRLLKICIPMLMSLFFDISL